MGVSTEIQWADSTVNPTMGCQGCELWGPERKSCYAGKSHERKQGKNLGFAAKFEVVETRAGRMAKAAGWSDLSGLRRLDKSWLDGHPRLIFVSDMSDALSKGVAFEYLESEIVAAAISPAGRCHRWLWLTKLSPRMAEFSGWLARRGVEWPQNLWAGTSITSQAAAKKRIEALLEVGSKNTVRFVSVEPQFDSIDLSPWLKRLDMVIQGGESGSKSEAAPFDLSWAVAMRDACERAGVAYFLKQLGRRPVVNGKPLDLRDPHGGDWDEWPQDVRVRQLPSGARAADASAPGSSAWNSFTKLDPIPELKPPLTDDDRQKTLSVLKEKGSHLSVDPEWVDGRAVSYAVWLIGPDRREVTVVKPFRSPASARAFIADLRKTVPRPTNVASADDLELQRDEALGILVEGEEAHIKVEGIDSFDDPVGWAVVCWVGSASDPDQEVTCGPFLTRREAREFRDRLVDESR